MVRSLGMSCSAQSQRWPRTQEGRQEVRKEEKEARKGASGDGEGDKEAEKERMIEGKGEERWGVERRGLIIVL